MSRRKDRARTLGLWIATNALPVTGGHPFYQRLNQVLDTHAFDAFVEAQCAPFYAATVGRPSLLPGTYFRLLLIGYFEGIDSERGIAWRTADSLALRGFLGLGLDEATPEHSTISRTRRLIDLETHRAVFTWIPYGATKRPRLVWLLAGRPLMARVASPPVAGVRRPACRPALASADEDPVDWPRRLAPHSRVVGCVRRCRNLVSIPGRSAASAVQPDVGHHHRRARPVPATGAPRGGVGGFVRRCGGCVAAAAGSRAVGRRWAWR